MAFALSAVMLLAGCGSATAPATRSLPLVTHARILENAAGGFGGGGFPGQYRYMFIAAEGISSRQLMVREARRLRAAGWRFVRTLTNSGGKRVQPIGSPGSVSDFKSSAAKLYVSFAPVTTVADAEGESEGDTGLTITRAIRRAVGYDGVMFATLRSSKLP